MAPPAAGVLAGVLNDIWASSLPLGERRRLAARVAAAALFGGGAPPEAGEAGQAIPLVEEALAAVRQLAGTTERFGISVAKQRLRERGPQGMALATRLGRLSKARNASAHPDVGIADDIRRLAAADDSTTADEASEAAEECGVAATAPTCEGPEQGTVPVAQQLAAEAASPEEQSTAAEAVQPRTRAEVLKPNEAEMIQIAVTDQQGGEVQFKIASTTPLRKLIEAYSRRSGIQASRLRLRWGALRILHDDTAQELGIEHGDIVEADIAPS